MDFQQGRTQQEYNERYYEEMLRVVQTYKHYSVLGHMNLIKRYDKAGVYPFERVKPIIAEILKIVIADGKGIEVNTSFHRYGLSESMPRHIWERISRRRKNCLGNWDFGISARMKRCSRYTIACNEETKDKKEDTAALGKCQKLFIII